MSNILLPQNISNETRQSNTRGEEYTIDITYLNLYSQQ
jgi:hypothetical protein